MAMKMDDWVKTYLGKGIDYDNTYGVQCVDLVKLFVDKVLDIKPQSIGNAIEYYNKRNTSKYLTDNFTWIDNTPTFIPQKGDIAVFTSKSGVGHVSICTGEGTTSYFYSYDQNYPTGKHEPMTEIKHIYASFLGVLRPVNQSNIVTVPEIKIGNYEITSSRGVYNGAGTSTGIKTVSQLTKNGKKFASSQNLSDDARLKKGTKVTIKKVIQNKIGNIWAEIPSGYILVWSKKTNKIFIK